MKIAWLSLILLFAASNTAISNQLEHPGNEAVLSPTDLDRVHEGVPAPDFTLESSDYDQINLSSYQGKKNVVLVFYRGYW